ncbi:unnamed protein product [Acanthoscelides obtectus]|uniref:Uncharacterized protein n=1 Tax=Acanthoscelides obtectus TaxID=200917 RepID=A0A9P0L3B2_ACAOB|nr:unnamed protein product [Acanthoscelides obtectus]
MQKSLLKSYEEREPAKSQACGSSQVNVHQPGLLFSDIVKQKNRDNSSVLSVQSVDSNTSDTSKVLDDIKSSFNLASMNICHRPNGSSELHAQVRGQRKQVDNDGGRPKLRRNLTPWLSMQVRKFNTIELTVYLDANAAGLDKHLLVVGSYRMDGMR